MPSKEEAQFLRILGKFLFGLISVLVSTVRYFQTAYIFYYHLGPVVFPNPSSQSNFVLYLCPVLASLILFDLLKSSFQSPGYSTDLTPPLDTYTECTICKHYKPFKSHHCSICDKCILDMDHHCIWLNNCIGRNNRQLFYRFIFLCILAGLYLTLTLAKTYFIISIESWDNLEISVFDRAVIKFLFPFGFSVFVVVGVLMGFQVYLAFKDWTTLDYLANSQDNSVCAKVLKCWKRNKKN